MKIKYLIQNSITIAALTMTTLALATSHATAHATKHANTASAGSVTKQTHTPLDAIQKHEKSFNFDWNNDATIAANQERLEDTEAYLKTVKMDASLSTADRQALGMLYYKLGTFYTHVAREPDTAIIKLNLADSLLTDPQDKAWNYNHLAYAYELKFATRGQPADKSKALEYVNKVITGIFPGIKNNQVAFADCVKGLVLNDAKDFAGAEANFKEALAIYEATPGAKDDQYARAKNRLANIILEQNGRDKEAIAMLEQLKKYWQAKGNISHDPYAARNLLSLSQAYIKVGNAKAALIELNTALTIYKNVYGDYSGMLARPNQLMADAYKKLGNDDQASIYQEQADLLGE